MILVVVGSQNFQFNRLLIKLDNLVKNGIIKEKIFAQIGVSDYKPKYYEYKDFLKEDELNKKIKESNLIIAHGGTGTIISALKLKKKVIGVPRLSKFKEHVDNHQIELIKEFEKMSLIESCLDIDNLGFCIKNIKNKKYKEYISKKEELINSIEEYIDSIK